jgi:hypothetical protein
MTGLQEIGRHIHNLASHLVSPILSLQGCVKTYPPRQAWVIAAFILIATAILK